MKFNEYESKSLEEIKKWELEKHDGFNKKILDATSKPINYIIDKIGPEKFKVFENAIEGTIKKLLFASTYTVDPKKLIKRAHDHGVMINDISELKRCSLELLDKCNREHISFHEIAGAAQGAAAGLGGALLATADITAVLVQDFHMIQEIGFCYGYEPNDIIEKEIILRIIQAGLGGSEIKFKALDEINLLKKMKGRNKKSDKLEIAAKGVSVLGSKALEESIQSVAVSLLGRLMRRALPIISVVISAHSNYEIIEHTGNMAFMVYRKRFLDRKRYLKNQS